jgi:release factor glutamine methyltransferase
MRMLELLRRGKNELKSASVESADLDAKLILKRLLKLDKMEELLLQVDATVDDNIAEEFSKNIKERILGKPVSKIIHKKFFWRDEFFVDENVLDPRPETETLIEAVIEDYKGSDKLKILDLGVGSGCIIISLLREFQNANGVAVDINKKSLTVAEINATRAGLTSRINFLESDWNGGLKGKFDVIVSNPPYIETDKIKFLENAVKKYEPLIALDGGYDGLDCYKCLAKNIGKNCKNTTKIYLEIGFGQFEAVKKIFERE